MMLGILYVPVLRCQVLSSEIDIAFGWASITKSNRADWSLFSIVLKTLSRIGPKVLVLMWAVHEGRQEKERSTRGYHNGSRAMTSVVDIDRQITECR